MKKVIAILVIMLFVSSMAYAVDCKLCGNLKSGDTSKVWGSRLCNGLANAALGWTEIFFRPGKVTAEGGNPIVGVFRGIGNAVARTGGGVVEAVTFWTPGDPVISLDSCPLCAYQK